MNDADVANDCDTSDGGVGDTWDGGDDDWDDLDDANDYDVDDEAHFWHLGEAPGRTTNQLYRFFPKSEEVVFVQKYKY